MSSCALRSSALRAASPESGLKNPTAAHPTVPPAAAVSRTSLCATPSPGRSTSSGVERAALTPLGMSEVPVPQTHAQALLLDVFKGVFETPLPDVESVISGAIAAAQQAETPAPARREPAAHGAAAGASGSSAKARRADSSAATAHPTPGHARPHPPAAAKRDGRTSARRTGAEPATPPDESATPSPAPSPPKPPESLARWAADVNALLTARAASAGELAAAAAYLAQAERDAAARDAAELARRDAEFTRLHRQAGLPTLPSNLMLDTERLARAKLCDPAAIVAPPPPEIVPRAVPTESRVLETTQAASIRRAASLAAIRTPAASPLAVTRPRAADASPGSSARARALATSVKASWHAQMGAQQLEHEKAILRRMNERKAYLRNPRFVTPTALDDPLCRKNATNRWLRLPLTPGGFEVSPAVALFADYEPGGVYEASVLVRNVAAVSAQLALTPPASLDFAIAELAWPAADGRLAPGLALRVCIQFRPRHRGEHSDELCLRTSQGGVISVPLIGRRDAPALSLPARLDCGHAFVGSVRRTCLRVVNNGGGARFCARGELRRDEADGASAGDGDQVLPSSAVVLGCFCFAPAAFALGPGEAVDVTCDYAPDAPGRASATLLFDCDNLCSYSFELFGESVVPAVRVCAIDETALPANAALAGVPAPGALLADEPVDVCFDTQGVGSCAARTLTIANAVPVPVTGVWRVFVVRPRAQDMSHLPGIRPPPPPEPPREVPLLPRSASPHGPSRDGASDDEPAGARTAAVVAHAATAAGAGADAASDECVFSVDCVTVQLDGDTSATQTVRLYFEPRALREYDQQLVLVAADAPECAILHVRLRGRGERRTLEVRPPALLASAPTLVGTTVERRVVLRNASNSVVSFRLSGFDSAVLAPLAGAGASRPVATPPGFDDELAMFEQTLGAEGVAERTTALDVSPSEGAVPPHGEVTLVLSARSKRAGTLLASLVVLANGLTGVPLPVQVSFCGASVACSAPDLSLGLLLPGQSLSRTLTLSNASLAAARFAWRLVDAAGQPLEPGVASVRITPSHGRLAPSRATQVSVAVTAQSVGTLLGFAECALADSEPIRLPMVLHVQEPRVVALRARVELGALYAAVPGAGQATLRNLSGATCAYRWLLRPGITVVPASGVFGPQEEICFALELQTTALGAFELLLACTVTGMAQPVVLQLVGEVQGPAVRLAVAPNEQHAGLELLSTGQPGVQAPVALDLGDVPIGGSLCTLVHLTNLTPIATRFALHCPRYGFRLDPPAPAVAPAAVRRGESSASLTAASEDVVGPSVAPARARSASQQPRRRTKRTLADVPPLLASQQASAAEQQALTVTPSSAARSTPCSMLGARPESASGDEMRRRARKALSHRRGLAFVFEPASGLLGPHERLTVVLSTFVNMRGVWQDELVASFDGVAQPVTLPLHVRVSGDVLRMDGNTMGLSFERRDGWGEAVPRVCFGAMLCGAPAVRRSLKFSNLSPFDVVIDWTLYLRKVNERPVDLALNVDAHSGAVQALIRERLEPAQGGPFRLEPASATVPALSSFTFVTTFESNEAASHMAFALGATRVLLGDGASTSALESGQALRVDFAASCVFPQLSTTSESVHFAVSYGAAESDPGYVRQVTLANRNPATLGFTISLVGPFRIDSAVASLPRACSFDSQAGVHRCSLPAGANVSLNVRFCPADAPADQLTARAAGPVDRTVTLSGALHVRFGNERSQTLACQAHVAFARLDVSTRALDMGSVFVGTRNRAQFTIVNRSRAHANWRLQFVSGTQDGQAIAAELVERMVAFEPAAGALPGKDGVEMPHEARVTMSFRAASAHSFVLQFSVSMAGCDDAPLIEVRGVGTLDESLNRPYEAAKLEMYL